MASELAKKRFEENLGLVLYLMKRLKVFRYFKRHSLEDIYQDACMGLWESCVRFTEINPEDKTTIKIAHYARSAIVHAIWKSRFRIKSIITVPHPRPGRDKDPEEKKPHKILSMFQLYGIYTLERKLADKFKDDPEVNSICDQLRMVLTDKEWMVIVGKYYYHRTNEELLEELKISQSRLYQLKDSAVIKMREWLGIKPKGKSDDKGE